MTTLVSLYENEIITTAQFYRIKHFIQVQKKWMISEQDPDHPMIHEEIERNMVQCIDIYLWCIDPLLVQKPYTTNQLARLWLEKKVYEMNSMDAATCIDTWLDV